MYSSILETIGRTPVVRINKLAPEGVNVFAKLEAFNPMGSVKDRMAFATIQAAEDNNQLKPGQTVIEATSGNTGIGLAMVCAVKGYPLVLVMAESFSIERRKILRFLGARVVLTPAELKGSGMLSKAEELAEKHGWFLVKQFENEANADAHTNTTAIEILDEFTDTSLDYFVTGFGTGGTFKGTSRVLREKSPETKIMVCEPDNSAMLSSGVTQERDDTGKPSVSHPSFRPHLMQGWSPDFIPKLTEDAVNAGYFDAILPIDGNEALAMTRRLATDEGIFCGTSGGATFCGALSVARNAPPGTNILCMIPDTGERYLSTPLFEEIQVEMSAEELDISRSTPNYRFDAPTSAPKPANETIDAGKPVSIKQDADAVAFFQQSISDAPVVMFALEWCEFCWSVRKLFSKLDVPYSSVDLDSVRFQENDLGGKLRSILLEETGAPTLPQIYIGGEHMGGATDLFSAFESGELQKKLKPQGIQMKTMQENFKPASLLPGWLHQR